MLRKKLLPIAGLGSISNHDSLMAVVCDCHNAVLRKLNFDTIAFRRYLDGKLAPNLASDAMNGRELYQDLDYGDIREANRTMCFGLTRELVTNLKSQGITAYIGIEEVQQNR